MQNLPRSVCKLSDKRPTAKVMGQPCSDSVCSARQLRSSSGGTAAMSLLLALTVCSLCSCPSSGGNACTSLMMVWRRAPRKKNNEQIENLFHDGLMLGNSLEQASS